MKAVRYMLAMFFSILVLVSSTSFMVGLHTCMGKVENIALFGKADSCQKERSLPACHQHMKPACCEDEFVYHEASDFKASVEHIDCVAPVPIDVGQPMILVSEVIPASPLSRTKYHNYDPPLGSRELTIAHQVFLI